MKPTSEGSPSSLVFTSEGTMWTWVTLLLWGLGWYKSINLVLMLAYLMFALLVLNAVLARRHSRRVVARREPTPPVFVGEDATIRVTATNLSTRTATVTVEEQTGDVRHRWFVQCLPGNEPVSCAAHARFLRRGRFAARLSVSSGFPLGFLRASHREGGGADLVVLPATAYVDVDGMRRWLQQSGSDGRARRVLRRVTTDQAEVRGVRPYRPGEPIRSVHWRSTARRRELMVREYDMAPSLDLVLVVEPWLPANPTPQQREQLELALSLAASIVRAWSRAYATTVVVGVAGDDATVRTATPTDASVRAALEPLAAVKGTAHAEALAPQVFDRTLARAVRGAGEQSPCLALYRDARPEHGSLRCSGLPLGRDTLVSGVRQVARGS
ncbi:MAG: DUF58 domain-containing protein [Gemmataceae bacterium]